MVQRASPEWHFGADCGSPRGVVRGESKRATPASGSTAVGTSSATAATTLKGRRGGEEVKEVKEGSLLVMPCLHAVCLTESEGTPEWSERESEE